MITSRNKFQQAQFNNASRRRIRKTLKEENNSILGYKFIQMKKKLPICIKRQTVKFTLSLHLQLGNFKYKLNKLLNVSSSNNKNILKI